MAQVLMASLLVGVLLAEVGLRVLRHPWLSDQLASLGLLAQQFHRATDDDARQAALLQCGLATLKLGVVALGVVLALTVVAVLPLAFLPSDERAQAAYAIGASIAATVWWMARRRGGGA